jgi:hypothetical protein
MLQTRLDAANAPVGQLLETLTPLLESARHAGKDVTGLSRKTVRRLAKASRSAQKDARGVVRQTIRRGSAAADAWRDPRPARQWPLIVGAFAAGAAIGFAASAVSQRYALVQATEEVQERAAQQPVVAQDDPET